MTIDPERLGPFDHWAIWRPVAGEPWILVAVNAAGYAEQHERHRVISTYGFVSPTRFIVYWADRSEAERQMVVRALRQP